MPNNSKTIKKALVTGAGSGIGAEHCRQLEQRGYALTISGSNKKKLEEFAKTLSAKPKLIICDIMDPKALASMLDEVANEPGGFDLVVPNAGYILPSPIATCEAVDLDRHVHINQLSHMHLIRAALPKMIENGRGNIICTVSMAGIISIADSAAYCAAKFGMRGFLWGLSQELKGTGVHVTGMYCSAVDTPMLRDEARQEHASPLVFMGKISTVEEVVTKALKAIDKPKLELYQPYMDSITARFAAIFPSLLHRLTPILYMKGRQGLKKYILKIDG